MSTREPRGAIVDALDAVLPQTQCGRCGYPACRPYAEAVAAGAADIDQCAPGGDATIAEMATVLGVAPKPLDRRFGTPPPPAVAAIDEARCIGCTLCLQACPVDAIVGAAKLMHTVVADACTGCELCVPPCPVDCIRMVAIAEPGPAQRKAMAATARRRYEARGQRLARARDDKAALEARRAAEDERRRQTIARAIARARARLNRDAR